MVNSPLIRPYFLGGSLVGVTLNSHDETRQLRMGFDQPAGMFFFFPLTKTVVHHGIYPVTLSIDVKDFKKQKKK